MNEISKQQLVVVTKTFGKFYVDQERARAIAELMEQDRSAKFSLDGALISATDIVGIVPPALIEEAEYAKNGNWKCTHGNWHKKFERCQCGWGMDTKMKEKKLEETNANPDAKLRAELIIKLRKKGLSIVAIGKAIKGKTNEEIMKIIDGYK